jgi:hypothetical protein
MLPSESAFVEIRSTLPAGNPPLKDIRDLEPIPMLPLFPLLLTALLLAGAALLARGFRKRRGRRTVTAPEPATAITPPSPTPYDVAARELARIEKQQWPRLGEVARHYEAVVDVLRDYLETGQGVPARERTTAELLWSLPPHLAFEGLRERFQRLLDEADLVKFARLEPDSRSAQAFLLGCKELLDQWHSASVPELTDALR